MLNYIWFSFFAISMVAALFQWLFNGHSEIFGLVISSMFDMARLSVEIAIGLVGVLAFWLGIFRVGEQSGLIEWLARKLSPVFRHLMPELPHGHPAIGSVTMNLSANMLGLDNAATPMGLKAMRDLQTVNPNPEVATNAQILFLVLNTSSVTLLPVTIFMYRAQQGADDPALVFLPILFATTVSTAAGLLMVAWIQGLSLINRAVLSFGAGFAVLLALILFFLSGAAGDELARRSSLLGNLTLLSVIVLFLGIGVKRRVPVYEVFVEGAKEGFQTAVTIIPYMVAMLVAIGAFRASGVLEYILGGLSTLVAFAGFDTEFVKALPTALMKPFSGSGSRALMLETMNTYGVDSFAGRLASIIQGSTETTFYVLTVYFGVAGIRQVRYAIWCGLFADFAGVIAAILAAYWFFG